MNHLNVFFNNRIIAENQFPLSNFSVRLGDWCLTPVRYLCDGNKLTVATHEGHLTVNHQKEFAGFKQGDMRKARYLHVIASIIFTIPGVIFGSILKGLGYISAKMREADANARKHYTPLDRTIGSKDRRLKLDEIREEILNMQNNNHFHQATKNFVVYAQNKTLINEDIGFMGLDARKIILVGAKIIHKRNTENRLDDLLKEDSRWNCAKERTFIGEERGKDVTFVKQFDVGSVEEAENSVALRRGLLSLKRFHQVYVVNGIESVA